MRSTDQLSAMQMAVLYATLMQAGACYSPPDFGESSSYTDEPTSTAHAQTFDLPVPANVDLRCAWGPSHLRTDDPRYTYDLSFYVENPAPDMMMDAPEGSDEERVPLEVPLPSPVSGYLTRATNPTYGTYAMIADDDARDYFVVGGIDRYITEHEDWVEPGDFVGATGGADGFPSILIVGLHRGSRAFPDTDNVSLPSTFRVVDVTTESGELKLPTTDFVCGEFGHTYRSLLGL